MHMQARKLLMSVLAGGTVVGVLAGLAIDPTMVPPPEPLWRQQPTPIAAPAEAFYQVEDPPQDLSPYLTPPAYRAMMARREAAEQRYLASLERIAPAPGLPDLPDYEVDSAGAVALDAAGRASDDAAAVEGAAAAAAEPSLVPVEPPADEPEPPVVVL